MLYGLNGNGDKILPFPKGRAICPTCNSILIAKCGEIKRWHWAHENHSECDRWSENEGEWHLRWKSYFPKDCVEVLYKTDSGLHRADIRTPKGRVIELQHSPISISEMRERQEAYGTNMVWIFDMSDLKNSDRLVFRSFKKEQKWERYQFKFKHKRLYTMAKGFHIIWDFGQINKLPLRPELYALERLLPNHYNHDGYIKKFMGPIINDRFDEYTDILFDFYMEEPVRG